MEQHQKGRNREFNIGKPVSEKILNSVGEYFSRNILKCLQKILAIDTWR